MKNNALRNLREVTADGRICGPIPDFSVEWYGPTDKLKMISRFLDATDVGIHPVENSELRGAGNVVIEAVNEIESMFREIYNDPKDE